MASVAHVARAGKARSSLTRAISSASLAHEDIVIGAGVVGVCTAHALASRGRKVRVLESRDSVGQGSSYVNGTLICPSLMLPWTGPQMIPKLIKSFADPKHPLKVHPHAILDRSLWSFGMHYLASCRPGMSNTNTGRLARLAAYSRACLEKLQRKDPSIAAHMDQTAKGTLQVFDDRNAMQMCLKASEEIRSAGVPLTVLSPEECNEVDANVVAAIRAQGKEAVYLFSELDTNGDCLKLTQRLTRSCENMGVRFDYDCRVRDFHRSHPSAAWQLALSDGRELCAANVVLCTGVESPQLAASLGLRLPMYPVKGYAVTVPLKPGAPQLHSNVVQDSKKLYLAPLGPRHVRITGCAEFEGAVATVDRTRANILLEQAKALMPNMLDCGAATYHAGLRPLSADDVPILGSAGPNLFLNTGHGSKGWTHAFGSAEIVADVVTGQTPELDVEPYDLARFWPLRQQLSRHWQLPLFLQSPSRVRVPELLT